MKKKLNYKKNKYQNIISSLTSSSKNTIPIYIYLEKRFPKVPPTNFQHSSVRIVRSFAVNASDSAGIAD